MWHAALPPEPCTAHLCPPEQRQLGDLGGESCCVARGMLGRCRGCRFRMRFGCPADAVPARAKEQSPDLTGSDPTAGARSGVSSRALASPFPHRHSAQALVMHFGYWRYPNLLRSPRRRERSRESFPFSHTSLLLLRKPLPRISPGTCLPRRGHTSISPKLP